MTEFSYSLVLINQQYEKLQNYVYNGIQNNQTLILRFYNSYYYLLIFLFSFNN